MPKLPTLRHWGSAVLPTFPFDSPSVAEPLVSVWAYLRAEREPRGPVLASIRVSQKIPAYSKAIPPSFHPIIGSTPQPCSPHRQVFLHRTSTARRLRKV